MEQNINMIEKNLSNLTIIITFFATLRRIDFSDTFYSLVIVNYSYNVIYISNNKKKTLSKSL